MQIQRTRRHPVDIGEASRDLVAEFSEGVNAMAHRLIWSLLVGLLVGALASPAGATILTFDGTAFPNNPDGSQPDPIEGIQIDDAYGDRVTSTSQNAGAFLYGVGAEGFTGDVVARYNSVPGVDLGVWRFDYGDLVRVLFSAGTSGILQIQLFADPAFDVLLYDFDMGSHLGDRVVNSITISEILGPDAVLSAQSNVTILGGATHSSFSFAPLQAHFLQITIDASNLPEAERELIAIDNIRFGQIERATPAVEASGPATLLVLGGGLAAVQLVRRRRR